MPDILPDNTVLIAIQPHWYTATMAAAYMGGINAKYVRALWSKGLLRFSQPDFGQRVTKKEWMDDYLESCEIKCQAELNNKIDRILWGIKNEKNGRKHNRTS